MTRIALISDIHYGEFSRTAELSVPGDPHKDETLNGASLIDGLVERIIGSGAQYICVAGDLTSKASPQEFAYCEEKLLSIARKAGIRDENIIIGLGNHDIDWSITELYQKYKERDLAFPHDLVKEKYRKIAANAVITNIEKIQRPTNSNSAPFTGVIDNNDFIMFVLNSGWHCTGGQEFPHGKLDNEQLQWFDNMARRYSSDSRWKIALLHHHPINYSYHIPSSDISMLEEGPAFVDIAGKYGIDLVLHGHRHHPKANTIQSNEWSKPITFICAGSLSANCEHRSNGEIPNTMHIVELSDHVGILNLENYEFTSSNGWVPVKENKPEIPLDYRMKLGKVVDDATINRCIAEFPSKGPIIRYDNVDEQLQFIPKDILMKRIKDRFRNEYDVTGNLSDGLALFKKGEPL